MEQRRQFGIDKENDQADDRTDGIEHPEPHGDLRLRPAFCFKVMMDRCGYEDLSAAKFL